MKIKYFVYAGLLFLMYQAAVIAIGVRHDMEAKAQLGEVWNILSNMRNKIQDYCVENKSCDNSKNGVIDKWPSLQDLGDNGTKFNYVDSLIMNDGVIRVIFSETAHKHRLAGRYMTIELEGKRVKGALKVAPIKVTTDIKHAALPMAFRDIDISRNEI